jgi:hypothetical protein
MREHGYLVPHWPSMATASSSLPIAVMECDGRIKEGAPSLLSPAWIGRTSRTPGFTCLPRGVLAIVGYRPDAASSSSSEASDGMATVRGCQVRLVDMVSVRSSSNCC